MDVPKGWTEGRVQDLLKGLESGISVNGEDKRKLPHEKAVLKVSAVSYGYFDNNAHKVIEGEQLKRAKTSPKKGQIIISRSNTEELVGASTYITKDYDNLFLPDKLWQTIPKPNANMKWLSYVLASKYARYTLSKLATGTSGSMKNITKGELLSLKVLIPPEKEQQKIAQILSTWDKAIHTTEQLLANSQQQKKALMQQLLTGKKRLSEFKDKWIEEKLEKLAEISTSNSKSKFIAESGKNLIIDMGSVSREGKLIATKKTDINNNLLKKGQLVMPKDDIGGGNIIGRTAYIDKSDHYVLSDHIYALLIKKIDSFFLNYLMNEFNINKSLRRKANGTAQLGLGKKDVLKQKIYYPKLKKEQQKIAQVLSCADKEIETLQQKLTGLKQEKQALMQQLLTGKRRVALEDGAISQ